MSEERVAYEAGPRPRLTRRQLDVLEFLVRYGQAHRTAPSLREIADHFGLLSQGTVAGHLAALQRAGMISRDHNRARSIRILGPAVEAVEGTLIADLVEAAITRRLLAIPPRSNTPAGLRAHGLAIRAMAEQLGIHLPMTESDQ